MPETITLPCRADLVATARGAVRTLLAATPVADDAALITSELVTNAVLWSRSGLPGGTITIIVEHDPETATARLEVHDAGPLPAADAPEDPDQHGRGLLIVFELGKLIHSSTRTSEIWGAELTWS